MATAYRICARFPKKKIVVLEKESSLAKHQTGHNSGVLHSGIYYKPGSLKAINCRKGKLAMEEFCREQGIEHELCGKIIVALNEEEIPRMEKIYERGRANGVRCEIIPRERILEIEPHAAGIRAIHVPECGIVNYRQVCERMGELISEANDNEILLGQEASEISGRRETVFWSQPIKPRSKPNSSSIAEVCIPIALPAWEGTNHRPRSYLSRVNTTSCERMPGTFAGI